MSSCWRRSAGFRCPESSQPQKCILQPHPPPPMYAVYPYHAKKVYQNLVQQHQENEDVLLDDRKCPDMITGPGNSNFAYVPVVTPPPVPLPTIFQNLDYPEASTCYEGISESFGPPSSYIEADESSPSTIIAGYHIAPTTFAISEANKYSPSSINKSQPSSSAHNIHEWEDELVLNDCKSQRRVNEILARCRYLFSKVGLDRLRFLQCLAEETEMEKVADHQLHREYYEMSKKNEELKRFGPHYQLEEKEKLILPPINGVELYNNPRKSVKQKGPSKISKSYLQQCMQTCQPSESCQFQGDSSGTTGTLPPISRAAAGTFSELLASHHANNDVFRANKLEEKLKK